MGLTKRKMMEEMDKEDERAREDKIKNQFSVWNGSHKGVTSAIKRSMNDPDSYKHVDTRYVDKGDHIMVYTSFRGKNAFGGVVTNAAIAKVDMNGNILKLEM